MKLTPKQKAFAQEYLKDLNGKQAAIRAGYAPIGASVQATRMLQFPHVAEYVASLMAEKSKRVQLDADRVLRELKALALSDIGDILDMSGPVPRLKAASDIPPHARKAISSVKVKRHIEGTGDAAREVEIIEFKLWDKLQALDRAMKYLGLLRDSGITANVTNNTVNVWRVEIVDE